MRVKFSDSLPKYLLLGIETLTFHAILCFLSLYILPGSGSDSLIHFPCRPTLAPSECPHDDQKCPKFQFSPLPVSNLSSDGVKTLYEPARRLKIEMGLKS